MAGLTPDTARASEVPLRILVVNAGSSSLKLRLLSANDELLAAEDLPPVDGERTPESIERFLRQASPVDAIGHRIVHGGTEFRQAVAVTDDVLRRLRDVSDLAPLHNPPALAVLDSARRLSPGVPNVACFDTAFHATIPARAATYAIPRRWIEQQGVRRYGFHGLSHAYAARRTAELLDRPPQKLRVVTCHLGAGASLAAVALGRCVDTTMGFTPLEGLVMATRSGSVDPGAVLWLQRSLRLSAREMEHILDKESGILALSGTADMREVMKRSDAGDERARLAFDVYIHRLSGSIASMAASMGGLDAIAFTGGVGEGSAHVRVAACAGVEFLGVAIDTDRNEAVIGADADITRPGASVRVTVVRAREDLEIAREVRAVAASRGDDEE